MRRTIAVSLLTVALLLVPAALNSAMGHGGGGHGGGHGFHGHNGFHGHFHGHGVIVVGPWWGPWWGLPAVLLPALLLPTAGRGTASARHRGRAAAVVLVLLHECQSLLPDGSNVPKGVDQSPAAQTVEPLAPI